MKSYKFTGFTLIFVLILFGIAGCDDDNGDTGISEPPSPPSFEHVNMDISVFENAGQAGDLAKFETPAWPAIPEMPNEPAEDQQAFGEAAFLATTSQMFVNAISQWNSIFFNDLQFLWAGKESCGSNSCTWEFLIPGALIDDEFDDMDVTEDISVTMTATMQNGGWAWELTFTAPEVGLNNTTMITAFQTEDGSEGYWNFHDPENPGIGPVLELNYVNEGGVTREINTTVVGEGVSINYTNDGSGNFTLSFMQDGIEVGFIDWSDDGTGCLTTPQDGTRCW